MSDSCRGLAAHLSEIMGVFMPVVIPGQGLQGREITTAQGSDHLGMLSLGLGGIWPGHPLKAQTAQSLPFGAGPGDHLPGPRKIG